MPARHWFVGYARANYSGLIDPHEDVGFLILYDQGAEFYGERSRLLLKREDVGAVRLGMNAHSLAGLGGWIAFVGKEPGRSVLCYIEPRVQSTLWRNRLLRPKLCRELKEWLATKN